MRKNAGGKVCVVRDLQDLETKVSDGCVLVVRRLGHEYDSVLGRVGAIISESDAGVEGNILALEHDIPCVLGVNDALSTLSEGMEVTVDGMRGLIYRGRVDVVV